MCALPRQRAPNGAGWFSLGVVCLFCWPSFVFAASASFSFLGTPDTTPDTVVLARIASGGAVRERWGELQLRVQHTLCGEVAVGDIIRVRLPGAESGIADGGGGSAAPPGAAHFGLWLLKRASRRGYASIKRYPCHAPFCWSMIEMPEQVPPGASSASCSSAIADQFITALHWMGRVHSGDLRPQTYTPMSGVFETLKDALRSLGPRQQLRIGRVLSKDPSPAIRVLGVIRLLHAGDPLGARLFAAEWPEIEKTRDSLNAVSALGAYANPRDGGAIRELGKLASLRSRFYLFDQTVAYVLRNVHTKDALPGLAMLLDSPNPVARSFAVTGMCLFTRNAALISPPSEHGYVGPEGRLPRPPAPFMTSETERHCRTLDAPQDPRELDPYLAFWKQWWQQTGAGASGNR